MSEAPFRVLATAYDYRPRLGGIATLTYELLSAMSRVEGVEVKLIAARSPGSDEYDAEHDSSRGSKVETTRVSLPSSAARAVLPLAAQLARHALTWRPHAVLNSLWLPEGAASLACAPLLVPARIPYFVNTYGVELLETRRNLRKRLRAALEPAKSAVLSSARAVFSISRFTAGLAAECSGAPDRVVLVRPGVDAAAYRPGPKPADLVERFGLQGRKVLLTIARLEPHKGIDRALASLRFVVERHPDVVYLICGDGKDRARLERLTRHYRMQKHVIFAGVIPFGRERDYYNLCDVFVLLSRDDREEPSVEGFGLVFLEAAACAKPSIGGASGGIPDAVAAGESGWIVDPCDDRAIADTILAALDDPGNTAAVGAQARERALRDFSWKAMAETMVAEMKARGRARVRN